ncbi:regucalcin-like [Mytilus galloprovincialis]|uniref:regucalcin-like n=1 Tax=Mytilus galloprovincialis TaxID=29158 RepID=UPI003F7C2D1A
MPIEVVRKNACSTIGEAPHWDEDSQCLFFVDICANSVHRWNAVTGVEQNIVLDNTVGFVVPWAKGGVIVGLGKTLTHLDWNIEKTTLLHEVDDGLDNRFNDGKCDPRGRIWAGTMGNGKDLALIPKEKGSLYSLDTDGTIKKHVENITISNGIAWSPDNKTMYYIDSVPGVVYAFDYDIDNGTICRQRTIAEFEKGPFGSPFPDGMTIDTDGMLWIACFFGGRVMRMDPETGKQIRTVEMPAKRITSCCFGGTKNDELYVTCCVEEDAEKFPLTGSVFKVTGLGVKGFPCYKYRGKCITTETETITAETETQSNL